MPFTAAAQQQLSTPPPTDYSIDERGVDLIAGTYNLSTTDVVIGDPSSGGLAYSRAYVGPGWRDSVTGTIDEDGSGGYFVSIGGVSEKFTFTGGVFVPTQNVGATLVADGFGGHVFTTADGVIYVFGAPSGDYDSPTQADRGRLVSITYPSGEKIEVNYRGVAVTTGNPNDPVVGARRVQSVTNNFGYQLKLGYAIDSPGSVANLPAFYRLTSVTGFNMAVDYCAPSAVVSSCAFSQTWPSATYSTSGTTQTVTDQSNRTTTYTFNSNRVATLQSPASSSPNVTIGYGANGLVSSVAVGSGTWTYAYADGGNLRTTTITDPDSNQWEAVSDLGTRRLNAWRNPFYKTTTFQYDSDGRVTRATEPEGNYVRYTYDARGNATETRAVAKSGSGLTDIVATATYPTACTTPITPATCNLPTTTTDPRLNVTNYTYAPHGGVLTVTAPAPGGGVTIQPEARYTYASQYAWYKDATGLVAQAPTPVTLLTQVSTCATTASCGGTTDEILTAMVYGSSGSANNLLPTGVTSGAPVGGPTATTAYAYTDDGDVRTVDGPLSGTADTTMFRYDDARQRIGVVGPDPDGSGALKHRAVRTTYNAAGQPTLSEQGTVNSYSDTDWTAFVSLQQQEAVYDVHLRPTQSRATAGGTTFAVQQLSYDTSNRASCSATRMNPAVFASLPSSACTLSTTAGYGPDRVVQIVYDAASRATSTISGLGTADALTESVTYTDNDLPLTLTDGNGNVSTLAYDGFDRLSHLYYPKEAGTGSSTTEYDEYGYDPAGNVVTTRTRSGTTRFTTAFDALNRATSITEPGGALNVVYTYDNLSRPLTAIKGGQTVSRSWDALSRQISEGGPFGTMAMQYDAAGRRTRLTWPDTNWYVTYDYDLTNAMTAIKQSGSTTIAAYAYDNMGRRTGISRSNSVATSYAYDPVSRLSTLAHDLAGTGSDQTYGYSYNPAGQIVSLSSSNNAYAYAPTAGNTGYTVNGQNQVTTVNNTPLTYDDNGNLTNDNARAFTFDLANRLSTNGGASTLSYDPLGRLDQYVGTAGARYSYDGVEVSAIATSGTTIATRFVRGPWPDEIVATFSGTSTTPVYFWLQDHLGSLVVSADTAGAAFAINAYDEYGIPKPNNAGRFQYTEQLWLPDFGVYHYKARAYHQRLGRFLQPDPIGYAAGANLYGYVGGDPVNFNDPLGLQDEATWVDDIVTTGRRILRVRPSIGNPGRFPHYNEWRSRGNVNVAEPRVNEPHQCRYGDRLSYLDPQSEGVGQRFTYSQNPVRGSYFVGAHGAPSGPVDRNFQPIGPGAMADTIRTSPGYSPGQPVTLGSCRTGRGGFPQALANELRACVTAPVGYGLLYSDGRPMTSGSLPQSRYGGGQYRTAEPWVTRCPE